MSAKIKLIIFDLDGTLIDAYAAITHSVNYVMKRLGYPLRDKFIVRMTVGKGDRQLISTFVDKKDADRAFALYRKQHAIDLPRYARLIPGAISVLRHLKKNGYTLAVASNRPTKFSLILLNCLKIKGYFSMVLCADKLEYPKPHPQILNAIMRKLKTPKSETLYVGDMTIDAKAAKNAGVKGVIVTGGSSTPAQIKEERPWRIIGKLTKLKGIV